jgi:dihydrofolate reductase
VSEFDLILFDLMCAFSFVPPDVLVFSSLESALNDIELIPHTSIFVIGGASVYTEAIKYLNCKRIFLTKVTLSSELEEECDSHFPEYSYVFREASDEEFLNVLGPNAPIGIFDGKLSFKFSLQIAR